MSQFNYQDILETYRQLQSKANAANESRYQDIIGTVGQTQQQVGGTYSKISDLLETIGESDRLRINQSETRGRGSVYQDAVSRGLTNTTVRDSLQRGVTSDADQAQGDVSERVGRQKAGILQAQAGAEERMGNFLAQMMEARTDKGPNTQLFAQLSQQLGAGEGALDASKQVIDTGFSANARSGRDVFGQEFQFGPSTGSVGGGGGGGAGSAGGAPTAGGGGGGGGGSGKADIVGPGSKRFTGAASQAAGRQATGGFGGAGTQGARTVGGPNPSNAGVAGSRFDNLFLGQDVYSGGDVTGTYAGGGGIDLTEGQNLIDQRGGIDPNRIPESLGGTTQTPKDRVDPFAGMDARERGMFNRRYGGMNF